ncbi:hypothetical protein RF11_04858 [Thelohanellus kitauei]|uniref:Uncharacterized protein n=1 Tax=Thelohanellus kitauei TaxID=669202 RepID=A0A0C2MHX8_THEKT|nr:hypothetical protein RF11_04858 [Thelohanellus kitauei]
MMRNIFIIVISLYICMNNTTTLVFKVDGWKVTVNFFGEFNATYNSTDEPRYDHYYFPTEKMIWENVTVGYFDIIVLGHYYKYNRSEDEDVAKDSLEIKLTYNYDPKWEVFEIPKYDLRYSSDDSAKKMIYGGSYLYVKIPTEPLFFEDINTDFFIEADSVTTSIDIYIANITAEFIGKKQLDS